MKKQIYYCMTIISKPEYWTKLLYPDNGEGEKVLSKYAFVFEHDGGYILFHTISWSMFFLDKDEFSQILENQALIEMRIVLDKNIDEDSIAEKAYIGRSELPNYPTYEKLSTYIILTTSSCNARCFYCYEHGMPVSTMRKNTADAVIEFIKKTARKDTNVLIQWFGGEPLLNKKAIYYIYDRLTEDGVKLNTSMITNGYLLDEETIKRFDKMKLSRIQITIDGLPETYNRIKNYRNDDDNPFETVMSNIECLLKNTKTNLTIRTNVTEDNVFEIDELFGMLIERFKPYFESKRMKVHAPEEYSLHKIKNSEKPQGVVEERNRVIEKYKKYMPKKALDAILKKQKLSHCMADGGNGVVIYPDGKLGVCEHNDNDTIIGNVFDGITDPTASEKFIKKGGGNIAKCKELGCRMLPMCLAFSACDTFKICSDEDYVEEHVEHLKKLVIQAYEEKKTPNE